MAESTRPTRRAGLIPLARFPFPQFQMKNPKKLSPAMQSVIDKMAEGWELCRQSGWGASVWLQRDGCGCGGPTMNVREHTFTALYKRGLFEPTTERFASPHRYHLKKTDGKAP